MISHIEKWELDPVMRATLVGNFNSFNTKSEIFKSAVRYQVSDIMSFGLFLANKISYSTNLCIIRQ